MIRALLILVLLLPLGCSGPGTSADIVLLILDAAPAHGAESLPGFDDFVRRGTAHERGYVVSGETDGTVRSIMTGLFPASPIGEATLAAALRGAGFASLAVDLRPGAENQWAQDFDAFLGAESQETIAELASTLAEGAPTFATVRLPAATAETGDLLRALFAAIGENSWILTAATGDPSAPILSEARIRVPLWSHRAGDRPGRRAGAYQSVDLFPMILSMAGVEEPFPATQAVAPGTARSIVYCQDDDRQSLMRERFKVVVGGDEELRLFDLETDPGETENRAAQNDWATVRSEMLQALADTAYWLENERGPIPEEDYALDPETLEELRSLGYLR